ncbi:MAG: energy transducer TonB [Bacteroidetes bacterium]|nr:energy transducer TonB [Bacteroidota bacterium]
MEKDGAVLDAKVIQGIDTLLDKKALVIVNTMGFWKPAYKNGHPVRSWNRVRIW